MLRFDGNTWTSPITPTADMLIGVWGSGVDRFVVGERGAILPWTGKWTHTLAGDLDLYGVGGRSGSDVFAVGTTGAILHYDGGVSWNKQSSGAAGTLQRVWTDASSHVFVVGNGGAILRRP